jgi:hypothetical protein
MSVPKSMKKMQDGVRGLPFSYILMCGIMAAIALSLILSVFTVTHKIIPGILLGIEFIVFIVFFKTPNKMKNTILAYRYYILVLMRKNTYAKYAKNAPESKLIPLVKTHPEGLNEFQDNVWGMIITIDPDRVSGDDMPRHLAAVKLLVDSLHGELKIKSLIINLGMKSRHTERVLMNQLNKPGRSQEEQNHIYSLYERAVKSTAAEPKKRYYIYLELGKAKGFEKALILKQRYYEGIRKRLTNAGMHVFLIQNESIIMQIYRSFFTRSEL